MIPPPYVTEPPIPGVVAGLVPGGYYLRVLGEDNVVLKSWTCNNPEEHQDAMESATAIALAYLAEGHKEALLAVFDGDTGRPVAVLGTRPKVDQA